MKEKQISNLLNIFRKTEKAIKRKDIIAIRNLSNQTIHSASIFQNEIDLSVAVLIYSLSKIYERSQYLDPKTLESLCNNCEKSLANAINKLEKKDIIGFENEVKQMLESLKKLEPKLKKNIERVIEKAKIHKASRIHEHGISIGKACELLGISQFELNEYVGSTGISDVQESVTIPIVKRVEMARRILS